LVEIDWWCGSGVMSSQPA